MDPKPDYLSMGGLDIEVADNEQSEVASQVDSEIYEKIMGTQKRVYEVSDHNGSLDEYTDCREIKIENIRGVRDEIFENGKSPQRIRFEANGDWYNPPKTCTESILKEIDRCGAERLLLVVKVNADGQFFWRLNGGFLHIQGVIKATSAIPVVDGAIEVLGGGLENIGKGSADSDMGMYVCTDHGKFYLSLSIKNALQVCIMAEYESFNSDSVESFLSGKRLLHEQSKRERIPGYKNPEELISLIDSTGQVIATNMGIPAKQRGRKRKSPE
jgi:hypothetical protein